MIGSPWYRIGVRSLLLSGLLFGTGARDGSAQLLSLEVGYRGRSSGPAYSFRPPGGPFIGLRLAPLTTGWASLGVDAFWVPSATDVVTPEFCTSMLSTGECVKRVDTTSESATHAGLSVRLGQLRNRGFFGEIGVGLYRLTQQGRNEFWASSDADHGESWHRATLVDAYDTGSYSEAGGYARIGAGLQIRLFERGPTVSPSVHYRWAETVGEGSYERNGAEVRVGVSLE